MAIDDKQSTYPPAPWRLRGEAACLLQLIDMAEARAMVPEELSIIPVFPGKTLGGIYLARYEAGSVLEYNELIVVPAMVWHRGRIGAWVSHIYVDDESSMAGGREIWGLPKELATFEFSGQAMSRVTVRLRDQVLCTLDTHVPRTTVRLPITLPAFGGRDDFPWFQGSGSARVGMTRGAIDIPSESPLAVLGSGRKYGLYCGELDVLAYSPTSLRS